MSAPDAFDPAEDRGPEQDIADKRPPVRPVDPAALALTIAQLAETDPHHELLIAARLALDIADARRAHRRALREASREVHAARSRGQWRRWAQEHVPFEELQRRRGHERGPDYRWRATDPTTNTGDAA
jgi:hypothetical protein